MRRAIRLKEFTPSSVIRHTPPDWYIQSKDSTLEKKECLIRTDEHGFILSGPTPVASSIRLVVLGDSVVEGMFVDENDRFCSRLETALSDLCDSPIQVLNSGYSGATSLHLYNMFVNKVIPLRPAAVILMSGIVDADVALRKAEYWSNDCWIEPIVDLDTNNTSRDNELRSRPDYSVREKILTMFQVASSLFDIPVWYATVPYRQISEGEYVQKAFSNRSAFDAVVATYRLVNASTRKFALDRGLSLFDLELGLMDMDNIYYDMFHHNSAGGEIVAKGLLEAGLLDAVTKRLKVLSDRGSDADIPSEERHLRVSDEIEPNADLWDKGKPDMDDFPTIHLINLDRSNERLRRFNERNGHLDNIVRVSATDGSTLDRETLISSGYISGDLEYGPGALGCALSHVKLWETAVAENRSITIFEDDIIVSQQFTKRAREVLSVLPTDWDIILWGYIFNPLFVWVDLVD
jgi:Glycosyltransferase family 25 (LPS biosynthesis protein)